MFFTLSKALAFLVHPLFYFWAFVVILLYRLWFRKAVLRAFLTLVIYTLFITSPISQLLVRSWENRYHGVLYPENVDAIVVLNGGSIYFNEATNQYLLGGTFARFLEGARLMNKIHARYIVASGGDPYPLPKDIRPESVSFAGWLMELGIPKEKIIIESTSVNTYQEAVNLKDVFREKNIKTFYVVTSALHMNRSMAVFQKQGFEPYAYPVDYLSNPFNEKLRFSVSNIGLLVSYLHESMGYIAYQVMRYI